jgi:hypothetical protein
MAQSTVSVIDAGKSTAAATLVAATRQQRPGAQVRAIGDYLVEPGCEMLGVEHLPLLPLGVARSVLTNQASDKLCAHRTLAFTPDMCDAALRTVHAANATSSNAAFHQFVTPATVKRRSGKGG